ncbi:hypothetical protein DIE18_02815 [Burkholderia sp. Bp9125]|nr:hypothetical protein DIE18_02815 [Burkholderia sp. Bp9125]
MRLRIALYGVYYTVKLPSSTTAQRTCERKVKIAFKDFLKTESAHLMDTIVHVANAWIAANKVTVLNVETLMDGPYREGGLRVWYRAA